MATKKKEVADLVLDHALSRLQLKEDDAFQNEIDKAGFKIFQCVSDNGFFSWTPGDGPYKHLSRVSAVDEVVDRIDLVAKPDALVPVSRLNLPRDVLSLPPQTFRNEFPFGQNEVSHIYVAANHRGVDFDKIDFCFGGSTLEMLASCDDSNPYIVTKIPSKHTLVVAKRKNYEANLADAGFQFERLVTGKEMGGRYDIDFVEHMHVMQIGTYKVLFCAEADAVDGDNQPVEIKASNPRYWGTKVMLQMVSNGSAKLCHGVKSRGQLVSVNVRSLSSVAKQAFDECQDIRAVEKHIISGMKSLKDQMEHAKREDESFKVSFAGKDLKLVPLRATRSTAVLPPPDVVKKLLDCKK
jgi:hypothetical protein